MRIVHVQTQIQTVFGVLDDDGNVIPQEPITARASIFHPDAFAEAYEAIKSARDEATANSLDESSSPEDVAMPNPPV